MAARYDKIEAKGTATRSDEGYLSAESIVTRTGVFHYRNADGTIRRELRHPDDVFSKDSMASLSGIPITNNHPSQGLVNSDNAKDLIIGHTGENVSVDAPYLRTKLKITHKDGVDSVDLGRKELSLGYTLTHEDVQGEYEGERYDCRQRNIKYNHLAIVDKGRAGPMARIHLDAEDAVQIEPKTNRKDSTDMEKVRIDGLSYDAAPQVINHLNKETARADAAESKVTKLETDAAEAKKKYDTLEAERDTLKEKAAKNLDAAELSKLAKARVAILQVAQKACDAETVKKLDAMDDAEIKTAVIKAKSPDANLDGKSADYIAARYDAIAEDIASQKTAGHQRQTMNERADSEGGKDLRADAAEAIRNQSKQKA